MEKGIYGISNALLDSPWPKVIQAKNLLSSSLEKNIIDKDDLISILRHTERHPDHLLPETGVGLEMERMLSPICIQSPIYGTRTHTLVMKEFSCQIIVKEVQTLTEDQREFIW